MLIDSLPDAHDFPLIPEMAKWAEGIWPTTMSRALGGEITSQEMMDILENGLIQQ